MSGLSRFGVDSPCPSISARMWLYGNSRSLMEQLREAAAEYEKDKESSFRVNPKQYQGAQSDGTALQLDPPSKISRSAYSKVEAPDIYTPMVPESH